jgi:hypothetical protein
MRARAPKVEQIDRHERHAGARRFLKLRRARLARRVCVDEIPPLGFRGYSG